MSSTQEELKPCLFTGKKPQFRRAKKRYCQMHGEPLEQDYIIFSDAVSFQASTKEECIKIWNTRAAEPLPEDRQRALEDLHFAVNQNLKIEKDYDSLISIALLTKDHWQTIRAALTAPTVDVEGLKCVALDYAENHHEMNPRVKMLIRALINYLCEEGHLQPTKEL